MALITCPHCGKSVSDSVETCIHCGGSLKDKPAPEKEREYAALPPEEQKKLREEFDSKYPEFTQTEKNGNITVLLYCIALGAFMLGDILTWVLSDISIVGCIVGAVIALAGFVGALITFFYSKSLNKKRLKCLKKFQKWLELEKRVHYTVILNEKDRRIFNQITID